MRFQGIVEWYAHFVVKAADIIIPLVQLLREGQQWKWRDEQQNAFDQWKVTLMRAPVFQILSEPFSIQCVACRYAIGALTQKDKDLKHLIYHII